MKASRTTVIANRAIGWVLSKATGLSQQELMLKLQQDNERAYNEKHKPNTDDSESSGQ